MAEKKENKSKSKGLKFLKVFAGTFIFIISLYVFFQTTPGKCISNKQYNGMANDVDLCTMEVFKLASAGKPGTYKDKNHAYFKNKIIESADPETFEHIGDHYAKDKNKVFFRGEIMEGADPNTFKRLARWYSLDSEHVYSDTSIIEGADPSTFKILANGYAADVDSIYYYSRKIEIANITSFSVIDGGFALDKNRLYYRGRIVEDVSPEMFEYTGREFGKMFIRNVDGEFVFEDLDGEFSISPKDEN